MKTNLILLTLTLLTCACIKPPDDGMALGDEVSVDAVNKVMADAQSGVPDTQAFHVQDNGIIQSLETVFSSVKLKELDVFTITSIDPSYIYFTDYAVRANKTTNYKMARVASAAPTPAPSPPAIPAPTPHQVSDASFFRKSIQNFVQYVFNKFDHALSKISIQPSTAVGDTPQLKQKQRNMTEADLRIQKKLFNAIHQNDDTTTIETTEGSQPLTGTSDGTTHKFYGLSSYQHTYVTNNCSQIKDCKVNATHIEFNQINTTATTSQRLHLVYEISKEVPGLFTVLSSCASAVVIVNNGQVPVMECEILDTFQFGGTTPSI